MRQCDSACVEKSKARKAKQRITTKVKAKGKAITSSPLIIPVFRSSPACLPFIGGSHGDEAVQRQR